jgi:hypothetical protein
MPISIMTRSAFAALLCSLSVAVHAVADNTTRHAINIPAEDLGQALDQLSRQSGTDLIYRPEQVRGLKTPGAPSATGLSAQTAGCWPGPRTTSAACNTSFTSRIFSRGVFPQKL